LLPRERGRIDISLSYGVIDSAVLVIESPFQLAFFSIQSVNYCTATPIAKTDKAACPAHSTGDVCTSLVLALFRLASGFTQQCCFL
jgi:hypothetical protein